MEICAWLLEATQTSLLNNSFRTAIELYMNTDEIIYFDSRLVLGSWAVKIAVTYYVLFF